MANRFRNRNRWQDQNWDDQDYGSYYDRGTSGVDWRPEDEQESLYTETWYFIPGPYSGMGPKNYNRSDERIEDQVNERLTRNGMVDARNISVGVSNGEVTLQGSVQTRAEKRIAEDIAYSVFGVHDIHNQLKVDRQNEGSRQEQGPRRRVNAWHQQQGRTEWNDENEQHVEEHDWQVGVPHYWKDSESEQGSGESGQGEHGQAENWLQNRVNRNADITSQPEDSLDQQRGEETRANLDQQEASDWGTTSSAAARADRDMEAGRGPEAQNFTHASSFASQDMYANSSVPPTGGVNNETTADPNQANHQEGIPPTGSTETATHIYVSPDPYTNDEQSPITSEDIPEPQERVEGIQVGMPVVGSQGMIVGHVKEVRENDFLLNRPLARDLYVPFDACQGVHEGKVKLNVLAEEIDQQGWEKPKLL